MNQQIKINQPTKNKRIIQFQKENITIKIVTFRQTKLSSSDFLMYDNFSFSFSFKCLTYDSGTEEE